MDPREHIAEIIEALEKEYPMAECTLDHNEAYELLVGVRLAAQCTDARVNMVTPALFAAYPTAEAMAKAEPEDIEPYIRSCGFYRGKAKDIVGAARMVVNDFGGRVPDNMEDLLKLPGVGRKSANLILGDVYHVPGAVLASGGWMIFSYAFAMYIDKFSGFSNMYGSLTTIILIMLWLYFGMYITLIGAEFNQLLAKRREKT